MYGIAVLSINIVTITDWPYTAKQALFKVWFKQGFSTFFLPFTPCLEFETRLLLVCFDLCNKATVEFARVYGMSFF